MYNTVIVIYATSSKMGFLNMLLVAYNVLCNQLRKVIFWNSKHSLRMSKQLCSDQMMPTPIQVRSVPQRCCQMRIKESRERKQRFQVGKTSKWVDKTKDRQKSVVGNRRKYPKLRSLIISRTEEFIEIGLVRVYRCLFARFLACCD